MATMFRSTIFRNIQLKNFDTTQVTNMSFMFQYSGGFRMDISSFNTNKVTIMSYVFQGLNARGLNISKLDTRNIKDFFSCFKLLS